MVSVVDGWEQCLVAPYMSASIPMGEDWVCSNRNRVGWLMISS